VLNPIFELDHVFIVFGPGSGGNFVTGLLNKLIRGDLTKLGISVTGSSHTVLTSKSTGGDSLSFGTISHEQIEFKSQAEREQYYINKINEEYVNINTPQVTWTHDYTNIPIYKKYFKNSRVLAMMNDTYLSRLSCICMHVTKILLDPNIEIPLKEPYKSDMMNSWKIRCKNAIAAYLSPDIAEDIFNKRLTEQYANDIVKYFSLRLLAQYFGMAGFAEGIDTGEFCRYDFALYPNIDKSLPDDLGENYYDYINDSDAILSYSYLINNQPNMLIDAIEKIMKRVLTEEEKVFILSEYTTYRDAQNKDILSDPIQYYQNAKELARTHIKKIIKDNKDKA